jgi:proteasome accessory factor A
MERLMGLENEYAFNATGPRGGAVEREGALVELNDIARQELPGLPSLSGNGIFLANGGRLYLDTGAHLEWCTPESNNPWDVVRYLAAGEHILLELASKLVKRRKLGTASFYKSNVDYSGAGSTWGAHENYMHRADPKSLPDDLVPFFVSRLIMCGGGGFDPTTPAAINFTLSPRTFHIAATVSNTSTGGRGIYHTKNEPLCTGGYHRMHVLCGESLCSQTGNWLKFASTGLVVALAEAGIRPGRDVALRSPVEAMRTYAADPTCRVTAPAVCGRQLSALSIQRHYLELARRHLNAPFMPDWAERAVHEWGNILTLLGDAPDSVATCLDWAIKHRVYDARIKKRGFDWKMLQHWSSLMALLRNCAESAPAKLPKGGLTAKYILDQAGPLSGIVRELRPYLLARNLDWDQCDRFLSLRLELFEIETRFAELGSGIFASLERAGVLQHQFDGVDGIAHAVENPPAIGRAKLRGDVIWRLHRDPSPYGCDWDVIVDGRRKVALDLRDPWAVDEKWNGRMPALPEFQRFLLMMEQESARSAAGDLAAAGS